MRPAKQGYGVAVVGASSLLGKELIAVLKEREFPVARLVTFEADKEEPDLPIVDLTEHSQVTVADEDMSDAELDFAFLARNPRSTLKKSAERSEPAFLRQSGEGHCLVIDLEGSMAARPGGVPSIPSLERDELSAPRAASGPKVFVSAHPATIVLSHLLLRLAARFELKSAVAQVFGPVSEIGSQAVEELQKQTVNLLSFQKIPRSVFGAQLAFNLLPRLGRAQSGPFGELETRIRRQLRTYLGERAPVPALRLFQVPVFYALSFSLYVEMAERASPEAVAQALAGEPLRVRRASERAPTQVDVAGSSEILVDAITADPDHPAGAWIWAVADNMRLAALNAVEIAETLSAAK